MGFWDGKRPPQENFADKEDIAKLRKELDLIRKQQEGKQQSGLLRAVKFGAEGFNDIAESLAHSQHKRRLRIAQMPGRKAPISRLNIHNPIAGANAGMHHHRISNAPRED